MRLIAIAALAAALMGTAHVEEDVLGDRELVDPVDDTPEIDGPDDRTDDPLVNLVSHADSVSFDLPLSADTL